MAPATSRSLLVPSCKPSMILVKVWATKVKHSDWERITASPLKAASTLSDAFTGTVVAVERGLVETDFKIGDVVAGITRGGWVDTLEESNQGYLNVPPASIWHISDASVKELEAVVPGTNDGCTIV